MDHFEATVRLLDLVEPDTATARRTVEERLTAAGFTRWQLVSVTKEGAVPAAAATRRAAKRARPAQPNYLGGRALMFGVVLWSLWLLWLIAG